MRRSASEVLRNLERRVARLERKASKFDHLKSPQTGKIYDHLRETAPRDEFRKLEKLYDEMNNHYDDESLEDRLTDFLESDGISFTKDVVIGGVKESQGMVLFDIYVPVFGGGYSLHKAGIKNSDYGVLLEEPKILKNY